MKIKNLREWINDLPTELDEHNIVFRKIEELDSENWSALDISIAACGIDEGNNEAYFVDTESAKIIDKD